MRGARRLLALLGVGLSLSLAPAGAAEPLVADLSNHLVAITTGFSGASVLLFGAVDGPGDVVVVVRGPPTPQLLRRKEAVMGIWINRDHAEIDDAPVFYHVASTRPLSEIAGPALLDRQQIGLDHLHFSVRGGDHGPGDAAWRAALLRLQRQTGLYGDQTGRISMMGQELFRTQLDLPVNIPTGSYQVEVYLFRHGDIVSAQTTPLIIGKIGVGATVYDFANRHALLYGLLAVLLAVAAGWLAAVAFKKA